MKAVTHNGDYHADDIFASAVLRLMYPDIEIIRSRDNEVITGADIVFDVGGEYSEATKRFDHHQKGGAGERSNGVPYASFGLVWKHFGEQVAGSKEAADIIDHKLVTPIDAIDNGVDLCKPNQLHVMPYSIQHAFGSFTPTWDEKKDLDEIFIELSELALNILKREIKQAQSTVLAEKKVSEIYEKTEDKRLLVLDASYPISIFLNYEDVIYFVYPGRGEHDWRVKGVRKRVDSFETKKPLPENWAGKTNDALEEATGVKGARFCHPGRHLIGADSLDAAIKLAKLALEA